jgi:hypothetical protein
MPWAPARLAGGERDGRGRCPPPLSTPLAPEPSPSPDHSFLRYSQPGPVQTSGSGLGTESDATWSRQVNSLIFTGTLRVGAPVGDRSLPTGGPGAPCGGKLHHGGHSGRARLRPGVTGVTITSKLPPAPKVTVPGRPRAGPGGSLTLVKSGRGGRSGGVFLRMVHPARRVAGFDRRPAREPRA